MSSVRSLTRSLTLKLRLSLFAFVVFVETRNIRVLLTCSKFHLNYGARDQVQVSIEESEKFHFSYI